MFEKYVADDGGKYKNIKVQNMVPSSAKLHLNKPTAMRLPFITKGTYL